MQNRGGFYDFKARKVESKHKCELQKELNNREKIVYNKKSILAMSSCCSSDSVLSGRQITTSSLTLILSRKGAAFSEKFVTICQTTWRHIRNNVILIISRVSATDVGITYHSGRHTTVKNIVKNSLSCGR